jgi:hypothetical protein
MLIFCRIATFVGGAISLSLWLSWMLWKWLSHVMELLKHDRHKFVWNWTFCFQYSVYPFIRVIKESKQFRDNTLMMVLRLGPFDLRHTSPSFWCQELCMSTLITKSLIKNVSSVSTQFWNKQRGSLLAINCDIKLMKLDDRRLCSGFVILL